MPQGRRRHRRNAGGLQADRSGHGRAERPGRDRPHIAPSRLREGMISRAEMKKEAGQVFPPPFFPLSGNPASLTEGDWPVVCWPIHIIEESRKKFRNDRKR